MTLGHQTCIGRKQTEKTAPLKRGRGKIISLKKGDSAYLNVSREVEIRSQRSEQDHGAH